MESFIQHRKGRTPRQVHRDLEDLKDDELGRYGFTGRTAHLYRRNDPTQFRAVGTHTGVDRFVTELTPTDQIDPSGEPLLMFYNDDCRISLSRRGQAARFWFRPVDGDELIFVHEAAVTSRPSSAGCPTGRVTTSTSPPRAAPIGRSRTTSRCC